MTNYGPSWDRFCSRNLGKWTGRSIAVSGDSARLVSSNEYILSVESLSPLRSNPDYVQLKANLLLNEFEVEPKQAESDHKNMISSRYNASSLWVFEDGSYTADTRFLSLSNILPRESVIPFAIEHSLSLSATERVRAFFIYDTGDHLETVVILEETREGLFENRAPLAITSLVGNWNGQAEAFHRPPAFSSFRGFGSSKSNNKSGTHGGLPQTQYSKEDLPDELKHGSAGKEGLMRMKTSVSYGWDPTAGSVRRTTSLADMQGVELGTSTLYGKICSEDGSLFDIIRCSDNSVIIALSNGCYVSAPKNRARGIPASSELGCLLTPHFRRRCVRTYASHGLASEMLASESRPS